jgi:hypothetical protein
MSSNATAKRSRVAAASRGLTAGVIAGLTFLVGTSLLTFFLGGSIGGPVRLEATIAVGDGALSRTYPLIGAAVIGLAVVVVSSALLGLVAAVIVTRTSGSRESLIHLFGLGVLMGVSVWAVADLLIATFAFPQFAVVDPLWQGALAHVVFFGLPLAGYLALTRPDYNGNEVHR